uniref:Kazrin, periplakin interacting protein a n=1 Tax=Sinocyclocheilus rhinocerous TaxID=307959 RepID=A0A673GE60_9TELE
MMDENKQLAQRIDGAIQCAKQEVANLRAELTATGHRLAELGELEEPGEPQGHQLQQQNHHVMHYNVKLCSLFVPVSLVLLHEEVVRLQEEVSVLKQVREMLNRELEETGGGCSVELLSVSQLRVQLTQKEQELDRAKEALQAMKADRKRLRLERTDLVNQMQQLYTTLESREEQLRDFIRNYEQHRKESEDAVRVLAREKDLLEREKWDLRRQTKEASEHASALRSALDLKENRIKELEAELTMVRSLKASPCVCDADGISMMSSAAARISPCHSKQPSVISDASVMEGERSSTPSDSPRHRAHSLCNSLENLEEQRRRKKKERMGLGSLSRVFGRGKQRKSLDPTLFDGTNTPDYYIEEDADW